MRLGLKGRLVVFVSAFIITFGVVLTALSVRAQNERLRHELEDRCKLLTTVIAAGREYVEVARADLGEKTYASFAAAGEALFVRTENHLFSIGETDHE